MTKSSLSPSEPAPFEGFHGSGLVRCCVSNRSVLNDGLMGTCGGWGGLKEALTLPGYCTSYGPEGRHHSTKSRIEEKRRKEERGAPWGCSGSVFETHLGGVWSLSWWGGVGALTALSGTHGSELDSLLFRN